MISTVDTRIYPGLSQSQDIEPHRSPAIGRGYCHHAGLGATILSSGVDVLVVPWVSVAFCVTRVRCHGDSVSPVPLRSVRFVGFPRSPVWFYGLVITVWIQSL